MDKLTPQERYNKRNTKMYSFRLNHKYDSDIIDYLDSQENKTALLKRLIREDMEKAED